MKEPSLRFTVALNVLSAIFMLAALVRANGGVRMLILAAIVLGFWGGWRLATHTACEIEHARHGE